MNAVYAFLDAVLPLEALQFSFMKNAFLAILLLTPLLGLLGTMAVNQQMAFSRMLWDTVRSRASDWALSWG